MKQWTVWLAVLIAIAAAGGAGYWLGHRGSAGGAAESDESESTTQPAVKPVQPVTVTPLRHGAISTQVVAFGNVVAPPSEVRVVSVPFESRVTRIVVVPGQTVKAGQPLLTVEASAATALAFEEARNTAAAAQRDLELVRQRYDQKLATSAELYTAQNALSTAQGRLKSLQQGGAGGPRSLAAEADGIVSKVDVQIGQVTPIGTPLVEYAAHNQVQVRLGVEPEDAQSLKVGQHVNLVAAEDPDAAVTAGQVRLIGQRVDPTTRLVEVTVGLPADSKLMLESFVTGRIDRPSEEGLVAPRDAVLPDPDGGFVLFTVDGDHAVKHPVTVTAENDREVVVSGADLKEGQPAVVSGNYELDDKMAVRVLGTEPEPATTAPSEAEPERSAAPTTAATASPTTAASAQSSTSPTSDPAGDQPDASPAGGGGAR